MDQLQLFFLASIEVKCVKVCTYNPLISSNFFTVDTWKWVASKSWTKTRWSKTTRKSRKWIVHCENKYVSSLLTSNNILQHLCHATRRSLVELKIPELFTVKMAKEFNLRWPNTVFMCALANKIQHAHKDCIKTNMVSTQRLFHLLSKLHS